MNTSEEKNTQPLQHIFRAHAHLLVSGGVSLEVRALDISPSYIHVISPNNLPPNMICQVNFKLNLPSNHWQICEIKAQVTHSIFSNQEGGFKVGLHFLSVPPQVQQALNDFLKN